MYKKLITKFCSHALFHLQLKRALMRLMVICLIVGMHFSVYAHAQKVTLNRKDASLTALLKEIKQQTGYNFLYDADAVRQAPKITLDVQSSDIKDVLDHCFKDLLLQYVIQGKNVIISKRDSKSIDKPTASEQQRSISGTVSNEKGEPLAGVSIQVKGTSMGTSTDGQGRYTITVPAENGVLVFSSLGYATQEVSVLGRPEVSIILKEQSSGLDEVLIVGYGTQKKVNLTAAVSTIDFEKETTSRPLTSVSTGLAGMAPGLQAMQSSGKPNSDHASILIRGAGTLNSSSPLVLVDGLEQNFADINPADVATISILKDAASSAIYGNRAANGVILITTKRGTKEKPFVSYKSLFSFNQPTNLIQLVNNSAHYMELMNESSTNVGQAPIFSQATIDLWRAAEKNPNDIASKGYPNYIAYPNTDWYKAVFQNKIQSEQSLSVGGASDKTSYALSATYLDNPGLTNMDGLKKYYLRSNVSYDINDRITVGNRTYGFQNDLGRSLISDVLNDIGFTKAVPSIYPYYDGKYGAPETNEEDPQSHNTLWDIQRIGGSSYTYSQINTSLFTDVKILKNLIYHANFDWTRYWREDTYMSKSIGKYSFSQDKYVISPPMPEELSSSFYALGDKRWRVEQTLTYNQTFGNRHEVGGMLGYEAIRKWGYNVDAQKRGLIDDSITDLSTATEMQAISGTNYEFASRSFFGRTTYAFDSRYLFEMNLRYDGSSRFAPESRWGWFPAFSAGWRLSEENFMKNVPIRNLKIRGSWGKLGNNSIGNYDWQPVYNTSNYPLGNSLSPGLAMTTLANTALRWESTAISNIGIEGGILRNRLFLEIDAYNKVTDGILYRPTIYATMGNKTGPYENIAEVTNRGMELSLRWNDTKGDFKYWLSGNFAYNQNRVTKYKGELSRGWNTDKDGNRVYVTNIGDVSTGSTNRIIEGRMINEFYTLEPYKGTGTYYHSDGIIDIHGGPKDGMIRTGADLEWLQAMQDAGYRFLPNQSIGKSAIWYGDYIYADLNGDGSYGNSADFNFRNLSAQPKYNFGLQAGLTWKGIDLSTNWVGATGFGIYWYAVGENSTATIFGYAIPRAVADDHYFYDPANPADPRTNLTSANSRLTRNSSSQSNQVSTLHLERGDFLKLRNLTIGYTIPTNVVDHLKIKSIRAFVSGDNLWTITGFSGIDPEMRSGKGYATMRQLAFGVNVGF